jgi:hypothetical protein
MEVVQHHHRHLYFSRAQQVQLLRGWRHPDLLLIPSIIRRRSRRQLCCLWGSGDTGCRKAVLSRELLSS